MVGVFGWLNTPSPLLITVTWVSLVGFLVILGLTVSKRRECVVLAGVIVGSLVITMVLIEWNSGTAGITWQARDGFPVYAGLLLVAGVIVRSDRSRVSGTSPAVGSRRSSPSAPASRN